METKNQEEDEEEEEKEEEVVSHPKSILHYTLQYM